MTRINIDLPPSELCDQHLIAEIHELPRCAALAVSRAEKGLRPDLSNVSPPVLGEGHVTWCLPFGLSLFGRLSSLCAEASWRGFSVNTDIARKFYERYPSEWFNAWPLDMVVKFRPVIRERICQRLTEMKRRPTWTRADQPEWVIDALSARPTEVR